MSRDSEFTVGDLRAHLQAYGDDVILSFDGDLTFSRVKTWSDNEAVLLFAEPQADVDKSFLRRNPNFKVGFIKIDDVEWDESGIVGGPISVSVR